MVIDAHGVLVISASKSDNVSGTSIIHWQDTSTNTPRRTPRSSLNDILYPNSVLHTYLIKIDRNYPTVLSSTSRMAVHYNAPVSISRAKLEY